ncbi:TetR-like C-terminal domain-containing protein [Mycobacterium asiaticum]|uniref:TetR family transcriptional regulator n=1 Tax=Mycobacterium asiaticum TaxID=1790 RepID=A0A1A3KIJ9_MYCAS|nr:TetR-like C-terminal domain-containing protein [Mycobacterium asiaticum]OBJ84233.1 TetR family transcriptional regulator [Mycobacterium asiaticum]ORA17498.1 TetR family transcriptional regulator [Mycobacterium asiaticum DSM 44297]
MGPIPAELESRVTTAVLDELARWGVERFSVEALAERHGLDVATIYDHWGDRQRLIVDIALRDLENLGALADTGTLRSDLLALARGVAAVINTEVGRTFLRALVMDARGHHDNDTRMMYWQNRFAIVRSVFDRARERGELRDNVSTLAAVQILLAPLNIRGLYSDGRIDDRYCVDVADLTWHAVARRP